MIQFGLMNRGQFPLHDDPAQRWQEILEQARLAEKLGYDSIMKGSHYTAYPLLDFQQLPYLARIMGEAPSLRLIAGIVLLPLHKPLDIAEQFANIDVMSGGRLVFGVGIGYREVEFQAFGTTQKDAPGRLEPYYTELAAQLAAFFAQDELDADALLASVGFDAGEIGQLRAAGVVE